LWEVHGLLVTRVLALRIVTVLHDSGVGKNSLSGSCNVGRLRVQTRVNERHLLKD
jgi:hypothetical protein